MPKIPFDAREVYTQATVLDELIPAWTSDSQNPINQFLPTSEQAFKPKPDPLKALRDQKRNARYESLTHASSEPIQLATTNKLKQRKASPLSKQREVNGMVTLIRGADNRELRRQMAQKEYRSGNDCVQPTPTVDFYGKPKFDLLGKPESIENPGHISVYNKLPKFWADKQKLQREKQTIADGLKGKQPWVAYTNRLPEKTVPMARPFKPKNAASEFLEKEKWENPLLLFSR